MEEWLDRYYNLRRRTGYDRPNFFVTNRGEKIVKIYDDVTKIFGQKLTASIFRKMVETSGRDHDAVTSGAIAQALQHSDRTANQYYRLPDATEALRRNKQIETVDHTALVKSYVDKNFEDLFPLEPYIKFDAEEWRAKIRDCQAFEEYPSATIDLFYVEKLGDKFYGAIMDKATFAVKEGIFTLDEAARRYGIPETTLRQHLIREKIVPKRAKRSYTKRGDNVELSRAVQLVMDGMSIGRAVRETQVAKTTLRKALALHKEDAKISLDYPVLPAFSGLFVNSLYIPSTSTEKNSQSIQETSISSFHNVPNIVESMSMKTVIYLMQISIIIIQ
ncbi:uncharacterized protein LOC132933029 [Metopolophium dirhodum]|uniref:uncharacterized protein LOC132933029 n=1 Tax=Metopolophium dirhodum TaxID=44670 RepID=UPI00298F7430|nr:uncharacterized protein LOC132933029 [Metopolophium dirhodum]